MPPFCCKLGFIVHPVGRGILDAPVNLHGKLTLPTAIIAFFSSEPGKMKHFSRLRQGCRALRMVQIGAINENLKATRKKADLFGLLFLRFS